MAGLLAALFSKKPTQPQGTTVADAAAVIKSRAYQMHVAEAKSMGEVPMTPEQFAAAQKK
jgi:hypothetical protein